MATKVDLVKGAYDMLREGHNFQEVASSFGHEAAVEAYKTANPTKAKIFVCVSQQEKDEVSKRAAAVGMSSSAWARELIKLGLRTPEGPSGSHFEGDDGEPEVLELRIADTP